MLCRVPVVSPACGRETRFGYKWVLFSRLREHRKEVLVLDGFLQKGGGGEGRGKT